MEYVIKTSNLTKKYGKEISVKNLNLNIPKGSVYGFLGPNGAGKTTTMKMILGLVLKTSGNIKVLDKEFNSKNQIEILKNIGSLIETPSYYGHLTAYENLEITCVLRGINKKEIAEVLSIVGLQNTEKKKVSNFSLGMKQRLGIANALLGKPKILLLDEPTNGLDPAGIAEIRDLIKTLPKVLDTTVLISSHLLSEIEQIADFVSIIDKGEIVFEGTLNKLREKSNPHFEIKTSDNKKAIEIFKDFSIRDDILICPIVSDDILIKMQANLLEHNIYMTRIFENSKSLEDIFLELTNKEIRV